MKSFSVGQVWHLREGKQGTPTLTIMEMNSESFLAKEKEENYEFQLLIDKYEQVENIPVRKGDYFEQNPHLRSDQPHLLMERQATTAKYCYEYRTTTRTALTSTTVYLFGNSWCVHCGRKAVWIQPNISVGDYDASGSRCTCLGAIEEIQQRYALQLLMCPLLDKLGQTFFGLYAQNSQVSDNIYSLILQKATPSSIRFLRSEHNGILSIGNIDNLFACSEIQEARKQNTYADPALVQFVEAVDKNILKLHELRDDWYKQIEKRMGNNWYTTGKEL